MYVTNMLINGGGEVGVTSIEMFEVTGVGVGVGLWERIKVHDGNVNVSMYGTVESVDVFAGEIVSGGTYMCKVAYDVCDAHRALFTERNCML
jgi:hypothetical protein